jgi:cellulose synthase/poly-beta-1,6-N-acetylglucosamine synthase-like glycosyltransferase
VHAVEQHVAGAMEGHALRISPPLSEEQVVSSERSPGDLPLVSVIIPVRNDAKRLDVCLSSLGIQDYSRMEIIVIDNGSTDDSLQVALRHGAKALHFPHLRVGALRNCGVKAARGEILAFIDSDHQAPDHWVRRAVDELLAAKKAVVGSPYLAPHDGTWVQRSWEHHRLRMRDRHSARWLGAGNMFLFQEDFLRVGGFREDLVASEDVDLCIRLARSSVKIISDVRLANIHHGEPTTLWRFFWKEYWRGSSGLWAFLTQGMPIRELPSLLFAAYHLLAVVGLLLSAIYGLMWQTATYAAAAMLLTVLPSFILSAKTCWQVKRLREFLPLTALYLTFGFSRAAALFKR